MKLNLMLELVFFLGVTRHKQIINSEYFRPEIVPGQKPYSKSNA